MPTGSPSRRRPGVEVRALVLAAAEDLFASQGYADTGTRDVAARAGVTEQAIYRHFGSKAGLYAAVVADPVAEFVDAYLAEVEALGSGLPLEEVVERFVRGFLALLRRHADTLLTVLAARTHADPALRRTAEEVVRRFADGIERTRALLDRQRDEHGLAGLDTTTAWAAMIGMLLGLAVHQDVLFGAGAPRPSEDDQVREVVALILHGIAHRP